MLSRCLDRRGEKVHVLERKAPPKKNWCKQDPAAGRWADIEVAAILDRASPGLWQRLALVALRCTADT